MKCPKCDNVINKPVQNCPFCGIPLMLAPSPFWRTLCGIRYGLLMLGSFVLGLLGGGAFRYWLGLTHSPGLFVVYFLIIFVVFIISVFLSRPGWICFVGVILSVLMIVAAVYFLIDAQSWSLCEGIFQNWPWANPK